MDVVAVVGVACSRPLKASHAQETERSHDSGKPQNPLERSLANDFLNSKNTTPTNTHSMKRPTGW